MALILVVGALSFLVYTILLYPVLIALFARLRPQRVAVDPTFEPTLSVCIPVHNGQAVLAAKLESLLSQDYPKSKMEILVYADGCTDDSEAIAHSYAERGVRLQVLSDPTRSGKPTGLGRMAEAAQGEVLVLTDTRQPLRPETLRKLCQRLCDPTVGAVSGNIELRGDSGAGFYWKYEQWIRTSEARFHSMLGATGPLYAIRKADMVPLPVDTILDDMWIPLQIRLQGKRLVLCEDAVVYDEAFGDAHEFDRKVRTLAGNYQLLARIPALLNPFCNRSWFELWSHKVLRLLLPWVLIALLVASVLATGHGPWLWWLLVGQSLFYLLALVGARAGRVGKIARTFVVLQIAALVGLWRYVRGSQPITWVTTRSTAAEAGLRSSSSSPDGPRIQP